MNNVLFSIVDEAMQSLSQTDAFNGMVQQDPFMSDAMKDLGNLLEKVKAIDPTLVEEIDDVTGRLMSASESCGTIYGLQMAEAFRAVVDNPLAFSKHVYSRVYGSEVRN